MHVKIRFPGQTQKDVRVTVWKHALSESLDDWSKATLLSLPIDAAFCFDKCSRHKQGRNGKTKQQDILNYFSDV